MREPLKIKVCGLRDPENIEQVCSLRPDLVGYIFYPGSRRFVGDDPDPAIFRIAGRGIGKVGVFVNEEARRVIQRVESFGLDVVQLHGSEPATYCGALKKRGIPVIKAVNPGWLDDPHRMSQYAREISYFLFDSSGKEEFGGTGRKFNWKPLEGYNHPVPFLLSGGIGPHDAARIRELENRKMYGVDVNSRFEISPGLKDVGLLKEFIREIRK